MESRQARSDFVNGVAFKVTYNDGGAKPGGLIGYRGVCSNHVILDNVKTRRMTNCSKAGGPCRIFADSNFSGTRPSLRGVPQWCYESTLLSDRPWRFGAGIYHHGHKEGQIIPMKQTSVGDIALLSTVQPGAPEDDRIIFAAFRVGQISEDPDWGIVVYSDESMDILLPDDVVSHLRFWNYYSNKNGSIAWQTGLFRYLNTSTTERILTDMMGLLGDSDDVRTIYDAFDQRLLPTLPRNSLGWGGEGPAHKALKLRVAADPTLIGLPESAVPHVEYPFISGDKVDIKFDLPDGRFAVVEIETTIPLPGAYQSVKYRALLQAEKSLPLTSDHVLAYLVAYTIDETTEVFANQYRIHTVQLTPA